MIDSTWIGSIGVAILLGAYLLNLSGRLEETGRGYHAANAVGAGLAAVASHLIGFLPFVLLEGAWCVAATLALLGIDFRSAREA